MSTGQVRKWIYDKARYSRQKAGWKPQRVEMPQHREYAVTLKMFDEVDITEFHEIADAVGFDIEKSAQDLISRPSPAKTRKVDLIGTHEVSSRSQIVATPMSLQRASAGKALGGNKSLNM